MPISKVLPILFALALSTSWQKAQAQPIRVVPIQEVIQQGVLRDHVIDYENGWAILRTPLFHTQGQDLFLASLPNLRGESLFRILSDYGHVWHLQEGEFAILRLSNQDRLEELAQNLHRLGANCGMIRFLDGHAIPEVFLPAAASLARRGPSLMGDPIPSLIGQVNVQNLQSAVLEMESWGTRHHSHETGRLAGQRVASMYQQLTPGHRKDVQIQLFSHSRSPQHSVIVRIPGRTLAHEVIVLGSHLDSINPSQRSRYAPGADDNASGTATNMEIFRVLMENNIFPDRTIEIHAYAAEEIGLVGSMEIAHTYRQNKVSVHAMIQFDMNGYAAQGFDRVWLVSNRTNPDLNRDLAQLTERYLGVPWSTAPLHAGTSDHASWDKYGYPVAFPFEEPRRSNPAIHTSRDTVQNMNAWDMAKTYTQLGLAYVLRFGTAL